MIVASLVDEVRRLADCVVYPPEGQPSVSDTHIIPEDVAEFYHVCGGLDLYTSSSWTLSIVRPSRVRLANHVIVMGLSPKDLREFMPERSWSLYVIGEGENGQYVTIDLSAERNGYCYDSFWDIYPDHVTLIASSFGELLQHLIDGHGSRFYWLDDGNRRT